jgi:phage-related minor tail protein
MSDSYGFGDPFLPTQTGDSGGDLPKTIDRTRASTNALGISATAFASALTKAFSDAVTGGKKLDDTIKSLGLRLSSLAVQAAFKPLARDLTKGLSGILNTIFGGTSGGGGATSGGPILSAFASGGVIGAPSYFPLSTGGLGLAGESGPEAILPLTRGSDGRLGVSVAGPAAPANVTVQIATPDAGSFRRSEAYLTGQIARAVARGQRGL